MLVAAPAPNLNGTELPDVEEPPKLKTGALVPPDEPASPAELDPKAITEGVPFAFDALPSVERVLSSSSPRCLLLCSSLLVSLLGILPKGKGGVLEVETGALADEFPNVKPPDGAPKEKAGFAEELSVLAPFSEPSGELPFSVARVLFAVGSVDFACVSVAAPKLKDGLGVSAALSFPDTSNLNGWSLLAGAGERQRKIQSVLLDSPLRLWRKERTLVHWNQMRMPHD